MNVTALIPGVMSYRTGSKSVVCNVWSDAAREAALEARRNKSWKKSEIPPASWGHLIAPNGVIHPMDAMAGHELYVQRRGFETISDALAKGWVRTGGGVTDSGKPSSKEATITVISPTRRSLDQARRLSEMYHDNGKDVVLTTGMSQSRDWFKIRPEDSFEAKWKTWESQQNII